MNTTCPHCGMDVHVLRVPSDGFPDAAEMSRAIQAYVDGRVAPSWRPVARKRIEVQIMKALASARFVRSEAAMLFANRGAKPTSRDIQLGRWIAAIGLEVAYEAGRRREWGNTRPGAGRPRKVAKKPTKRAASAR